MKAILFVVLQIIVLSRTNAQFKASDFQKFWVCNSFEVQKEESINDGYLDVCPKLATWQVFSNQLYLMLESKTKGDTLILLYKKNDIGAGFSNFKTWPVVNKPFAKLYRISADKIGIIYLNKAFVKAIKQSVNAPMEEKKLIFPTVLFLNEKRKSTCGN